MNQVWVSDITYVEIKAVNRSYWMYLSLITDVYTHEIVGYALHDTLDTAGPLRALEMAIGEFPAGTLQGLIHHSDRGAQYCSKEYVSVLQKNGIRVSMTENGDPYENAIAERTNGILKTEWLYHEVLRGPVHAQKRIDEIIYTYNHRRPHMSIGNLTRSGEAVEELLRAEARISQNSTCLPMIIDYLCKTQVNLYQDVQVLTH